MTTNTHTLTLLDFGNKVMETKTTDEVFDIFDNEDDMCEVFRKMAREYVYCVVLLEEMSETLIKQREKHNER